MRDRTLTKMRRMTTTEVTVTIVEPLAELKLFVSQYQRQGEAAKALGISQPYLGDMLRGNRAVGPKVLKRLGLQRTITRK